MNDLQKYALNKIIELHKKIVETRDELRFVDKTPEAVFPIFKRITPLEQEYNEIVNALKATL